MWQLLGTLYQIAIGTAGCAGRLSQHAATIKKEDKEMSNKRLTTRNGAPVVDNQNVITAGPRGPMLLQDVWFLEKLAHFDREVIPERRMHAKGSGAYGTFTVTHDITRYTRAKIFSEIGKKTELFVRFPPCKARVVRAIRCATCAVLP